VDDCNCWPAVNFVSLHGSNSIPACPIELRSSANAWGASTTEGTLTHARPTWYAYLATPIYRPDWRIYWNGTPYAAPYVGEAFLGYVEPWVLGPQDGFSVSLSPVASGEAKGSLVRQASGKDAARRLELTFRSATSAHRAWVLDELIYRTRGGLDPVLLYATGEEAIPDGAYYGRYDVGPYASTASGWFIGDVKMAFQEQAFPWVLV
jgi:hypothetical protein